MRIKAILKDIGIVFGLTILWSSMNSAGLDDNAAVMLIILTFVYIFMDWQKAVKIQVVKQKVCY